MLGILGSRKMMSKNTLKTNRTQIGFFGLRNSGKSSLVNRIANQEMSIVSDVPGTTTDPVQKSMELIPIGPVVLIDTPGVDDEGDLGSLRVKKALRILDRIHLAILVVDVQRGLTQHDEEMIKRFKEKNLPYIIAYNKVDSLRESPPQSTENEVYLSAKTGENLNQFMELVSKHVGKKNTSFMLSDKISQGDLLIHVILIDESAPQGRFILPQQMVIRDILDKNALSLLVNLENLEESFEKFSVKPKLVITDSQIFKEVEKKIPKDVSLTSYSIIMARYKGQLEELVEGVYQLDHLKKKRILISEACSHRRQCNDIGTVKMPEWIRSYTGMDDLVFDFTQGNTFIEDLSPYDLVLHCGACMINEKEMNARIQYAQDAGVPISNYGMVIAYMNGILDRALDFFRS